MSDRPLSPAPYFTVHSWLVRTCHWINALAIVVMAMSGWRIYNAAPLFDFRFPVELTLGGWLAGALQWHFAMMWLLALNGAVYLMYALTLGHFRKHFLPIGKLAPDLKRTITFKLKHRAGVYNGLQRLAYMGVVFVLILTVASGLALWKPVQLRELVWLQGGYEGARYVHFFAMGLLVVFVAIHVPMALIVPKSLISMITGKAQVPPTASPPGHADFLGTEAGDAL